STGVRSAWGRLCRSSSAFLVGDGPSLTGTTDIWPDLCELLSDVDEDAGRRGSVTEDLRLMAPTLLKG
ncbi:hypothetical protein, partial [Streptomyces sp. NTH33]|uniref:hypothetical protein n=1 Tax=Streptomyces sp. NTH33 TaxID=1735453 RepID=UPI001C64AB4E